MTRSSRFSGVRPTLRIVYVAPLPRAPLIRSLPLTQPSGLPVYLAPFPWARLTRLRPAFSPFGLPVHLIASPAFETRSRPPLSRRYPRGFAFYVAFPKSSIRLSLPICVAQFPSVHSGIRPSHCAALGAGAELVVLVFEQDVECMISDLYLGTSRRTRPLPRGVAGHVAHPIRSIQISDFRFLISETLRVLLNQCSTLKPGFNGRITTSIRAASSDFEARRLLRQSARHRRQRAPGTGPMLVPSLQRYQAYPLSKPGIESARIFTGRRRLSAEG